jgi:hypothetical protein
VVGGLGEHRALLHSLVFAHSAALSSWCRRCRKECYFYPRLVTNASACWFLGFSEFVEFICRVAVEGMQQENYDVVFPTPFSKVRTVAGARAV